jgi:hypothetical protein
MTSATRKANSQVAIVVDPSTSKEVDTIDYRETLVVMNLPGGMFVVLHNNQALLGSYARSVIGGDRLDPMTLVTLANISHDGQGLTLTRSSFLGHAGLTSRQRDTLSKHQERVCKWFDSQLAQGKLTYSDLTRAGALDGMAEGEYFRWISDNNQRLIRKQAMTAAGEASSMLDVLFS